MSVCAMVGYWVTTQLIPKRMMYDNLPVDSNVRELCEAEEFFVSDRPRDWRFAFVYCQDASCLGLMLC
jgi:hypothetical protein